MGWGYGYYGFPPYVSVAQRKAKAAEQLKKMEKKGVRLQPVVLPGKKIASTFWGKAWCGNLESYMDFENRLPRGRSYVRNGSVLHMEIKAGTIEAKVAGSSLYTVNIQIQPVASSQWKRLCTECSGQIGSLLELLSGKLSDRVMGIMTRRESGLFPAPKEIKLKCSCPDDATLCKHIAAVLYGVGARLDSNPELLFLLRSVDQNELVAQAVEADLTAGGLPPSAGALAADELSDVFGIEIDTAAPQKPKAKKVVAAKTQAPSRSSAGKNKKPIKVVATKQSSVRRARKAPLKTKRKS